LRNFFAWAIAFRQAEVATAGLDTTVALLLASEQPE
jgi:hypothetical protein